MIKWRNIPGLPDAIEKAGLTCYLLNNEWVVCDAEKVQAFIDAYEPPAKQRKLIGVEFEGVMCSATSADQAGLMAVFIAIQTQGEFFQPTRFEFENGSILTITLENHRAFMMAWMPFRQSFFRAD
jgi:hypothetical protein